jgi:hypothetical protein
MIAYKIANLLQFYTVTMTRTIGPNALLSKTLHEYALGHRVFPSADN